MKKINANVVILITTFLSVLPPVFAAAPVNDISINNSNASLDKQVQELTRLLEMRNKMQVRLQAQVNELASEISQMKGSIELSNHKIEQVESRQRDLYQLVDEQNKPAVKPVAASIPVAQGDEKAAYQQAVDLVLVSKEYDQAIIAFEAFVIDYPQSSYIANSYYWLGQLLYKQKKRNEARKAFLTVTEQYPKSSKRPDALFKIGIIDEYLGDLASAKIFYNKVIEEFPDSSAAGLSKKRLNTF